MANISLSNTYGIYAAMSNGLYSGTVGGGGNSGSSNATSGDAFRNLVINGGMIVDQRLEGAISNASSNGDYYACDRFFLRALPSSLPAYTVQRITVSDADNSITGQNFSIRAQATSNVTIGSATTNFVGLFHNIEGAISAPLQWGTSNGRSTTLSFYIKTNVTGTHWVALKNFANSYSYVSTFSVSNANTYTKVTQTIPAPPANSVWMSDSNLGIKLAFDVCAGGTAASSNNSWISGDFVFPSGLTGSATSNMWGISNNYVELSGVQFETGSSATSFEYRPFTLEKNLCERYFEKSHPNGVSITSIVPQSAPGIATYMFGSTSTTQVPFATTKRSLPNMTFYNPYSSNGNAATDLSYSSNLTVYAPNISKFGVTSTDSTLWNRNVYFNWAANCEYSTKTVYNIIQSTSGLMTTSSPTTVLNSNVDDGAYKITIPFTWNYLNKNYGGDSNGGVYICTNSYITFGASSQIYSNFAASNPAVPTVMIGAADNSAQRILTYNDTTNHWFLVQYEGTNATTGTVGSPTITWQMVFLDPAYWIYPWKLITGNVNNTSSSNTMVTDGSSILKSFTYGSGNLYFFSQTTSET